MDSPIVTQLFRQLFRHHPACQSRRNLATLATALRDVRRQRLHDQQLRQPQHHHQHRHYATRGRGVSGSGSDRTESNWQQRTDIFQQDMSEEFQKYPMVTALDLRGRKDRPRRVKMLMRDFIEGSCADVACAEVIMIRGGTIADMSTLSASRQSLQPKLRLLFQTSRHLHPR